MAGKIKQMIDTIIAQRAKGNPTLVSVTVTKLVLKGIDPERYNAQSPDDPVMIDKLSALAKDLGVAL